MRTKYGEFQKEDFQVERRIGISFQSWINSINVENVSFKAFLSMYFSAILYLETNAILSFTPCINIKTNISLQAILYSFNRFSSH